jgi:hypothetical protein
MAVESDQTESETKIFFNQKLASEKPFLTTLTGICQLCYFSKHFVFPCYFLKTENVPAPKRVSLDFEFRFGYTGCSDTNA